MLKPTAFWANHLKEFRSNKRLRYASFIVLFIILTDVSLRWTDRIDAKHKEFTILTAEITALKQQSQDEVQLKEVLAKATEAQDQAKARLWIAPSDAIGQARLKDWLLDLIARIGATNTGLNIANPRPLGENEDKPLTNIAGVNNSVGLKRFRATLTLRFAPETLEHLLAELEGAEPFVTIDTLVVNRREMRVEIGLGVLIDIQPTENGSGL